MDFTPAELAELDQLRAGAEQELDQKIDVVRELFATYDDDTATGIVNQLVAGSGDTLVRGALILSLIRLAKQGTGQ